MSEPRHPRFSRSLRQRQYITSLSNILAAMQLSEERFMDRRIGNDTIWEFLYHTFIMNAMSDSAPLVHVFTEALLHMSQGTFPNDHVTEPVNFSENDVQRLFMIMEPTVFQLIADILRWDTHGSFVHPVIEGAITAEENRRSIMRNVEKDIDGI